ncbi:MAG: hypothetical protein AAGC46_14420 [Solirubrobacteraceae bacterium]|nr:hypothetical protein [Patulibacter sp.]
MAQDPAGSPRIQRLRSRIPAQTAATTANQALLVASEDGTVTAASFTPDAAITGATATKRTITLENRGQSGSGSTVIGTLDLVTGVNPAAFAQSVLTLSGTAANLSVTAGDVLAVKEAVTSTGTANPGGLVEVAITRR